MDNKTRGETGVTAEQARKITESCAPRVDRELYGQACREIRSAAQVGKHSCLLPIEYGYEQQNALAKRLVGDGFWVDWVTDNGPRTDDCAVMKIKW